MVMREQGSREVASSNVARDIRGDVQRLNAQSRLMILILEGRKVKAKWICHTHRGEKGWYPSASHGDGTDHKSPEGASTEVSTKTDDKSWPVIQSCSPRPAGPEGVSRWSLSRGGVREHDTLARHRAWSA
jgi:hypothetical protein